MILRCAEVNLRVGREVALHGKACLRAEVALSVIERCTVIFERLAVLRDGRRRATCDVEALPEALAGAASAGARADPRLSVNQQKKRNEQTKEQQAWYQAGYVDESRQQ